MPNFYFTAKSSDGQAKTGTLEAKDESNLAQSLRQQGLILISAQILGQEKDKGKSQSLLFRFKKIFLRRVSLMERLIFTRHLSIMIGAGFSLHKALEVLANQTPNQNFKKVIRGIVEGVKRGETFADCLAKYPKVFNNFFVSMVKVGEKGGNLEEVLKILTLYLKREHDFATKVRGAMIYPAVIVVAMIGIGIIMMITVVPKITAMFEELHTTLPFTTQIIMAISKFFARYYIIGGISLILLVFFSIKFFKTKRGARFLSLVFIKTPFFKKLTQKMNCAKLSRSLASLMESGVPIVESLTITAQILSNFFYSNSLLGIAIEVKKGKTIQESLEGYKNIYPMLVGQMIGVGEQTGELSEIMHRLADFYEEEVTNITENLASVIEPVMMIIIGAAVGFFAVSMIQPMYSMMNAL